MGGTLGTGWEGIGGQGRGTSRGWPGGLAGATGAYASNFDAVWLGESEAVRDDNVTVTLESGTELHEIVDLSVAHHPHRLVLVGDGLVPAGNINDA